MGEMFRSDKMALCQLYLQPESAYTTLSELGELGVVQFRDLNEGLTVYQRRFIAEVRRCEEMERQINYLQKEMEKFGMICEEPEIAIRDEIRAPPQRELAHLESRLENAEKELDELTQNERDLSKNYLELTEMKYVLENSHDFFNDRELMHMDAKAGGEGGASLLFVAGVIERERVQGFQKMLWRVSRGCVFFRHADIEKPVKELATGREVYKNAFIAFYQGDQLNTKVKKICTGFHASLYSCPRHHTERDDMLKGVINRLADLQTVLNQTEDHRKRVLFGIYKDIMTIFFKVVKMKAIYHAMNNFNTDLTNKCLVGEAWTSKRDIEIVRECILQGSIASGCSVHSFMNLIETDEEPPTLNRTNKFTYGFQMLIDSYGVSSYREVNPALYTIITFPFLFAVMFGDLGHGCIIALFGIWMVADEKRLGAKRSNNEIWNIFFGGRYIIMLMGLFSMYTGFMYNELFSISINVFGSTWKNFYNESTVMDPSNSYLQMDPKSDTYDVYVMGIDPVWYAADNRIIFTNSFKMKMSIIFGVVHMVFGICISVVNFFHFKKAVNIVLEFIPQILFLILLFGYMAFMMFYKFVKYTAQPPENNFPDEYTYLTPGCAPSVLILFINMVLFKPASGYAPKDHCDALMYGGEVTVQTAFVIVALICIPWLLLAKPLYIQAARSIKAKRSGQHMEYDVTIENEKNHTFTEIDIEVDNKSVKSEKRAEASHSHSHEDEPMSEIWIHQAIHTIEYILSTISHTASYLRLWALSLAHSQLSDVLYTMVWRIGTGDHGYAGCIILFFIFAIWAALTIAILVMMEGLSAFLHTLRLHWVEFMSKFYTGAGVSFSPFSMKRILNSIGGD
ncbi:unc-32.2 family protein [Megaselia abdita]